MRLTARRVPRRRVRRGTPAKPVGRPARAVGRDPHRFDRRPAAGVVGQTAGRPHEITPQRGRTCVDAIVGVVAERRSGFPRREVRPSHRGRRRISSISQIRRTPVPGCGRRYPSPGMRRRATAARRTCLRVAVVSGSGCGRRPRESRLRLSRSRARAQDLQPRALAFGRPIAQQVKVVCAATRVAVTAAPVGLSAAASASYSAGQVRVVAVADRCTIAMQRGCVHRPAGCPPARCTPCAAAATRALNVAAPTRHRAAPEADVHRRGVLGGRAECSPNPSRASICQGWMFPPDGARDRRRGDDLRRGSSFESAMPTRFESVEVRRSGGVRDGLGVSSRRAPRRCRSGPGRTAVLRPDRSAGPLRRRRSRRARPRRPAAATSSASCPTSISDAAIRGGQLRPHRVIRSTWGTLSSLVKSGELCRVDVAEQAVQDRPRRARDRTARRPPGRDRWSPSAPAAAGRARPRGRGPSCPASRIPRRRCRGRPRNSSMVSAVMPAGQSPSPAGTGRVRRSAGRHTTALFTPRSNTVAGTRLRLDSSRLIEVGEPQLAA